MNRYGNSLSVRPGIGLRVARWDLLDGSSGPRSVSKRFSGVDGRANSPPCVTLQSPSDRWPLFLVGNLLLFRKSLGDQLRQSLHRVGRVTTCCVNGQLRPLDRK